MCLIVGRRDTLHECFHQHHIFGGFLEGKGEVDVDTLFEHFVESVKVVHFEGEVQLLSQGPLERVLTDRDLHTWPEERSSVAQPEKQVDVSFDMLVDSWMPYLHCYFFSLVLCLVDLTH